MPKQEDTSCGFKSRCWQRICVILKLNSGLSILPEKCAAIWRCHFIELTKDFFGYRNHRKQERDSSSQASPPAGWVASHRWRHLVGDLTIRLAAGNTYSSSKTLIYYWHPLEKSSAKGQSALCIEYPVAKYRALATWCGDLVLRVGYHDGLKLKRLSTSVT